MSIESIEARLEAATKGPWCRMPPPYDLEIVRPIQRSNFEVCGGYADGADTDMIAHAPADLAALLAVARAAAEVRHYRDVHGCETILDVAWDEFDAAIAKLEEMP